MTASSRPVTIITGGSQGIGAATARYLARNGHDVLVAYRSNSDLAGEVCRDATAAGVRSVALAVDVTQPDDVERLFEEARRLLGPVTGLVNNAGATLHVAELADTPVDVVRQVLDVNLMGAILCARSAARMMSTSRGGLGGTIVNISSVAATLGAPHEYVHYAAAKAGVETLTVGLAKELADQGVRVNAVSPGTVRTGIHAGAGDPGRPGRVAARIPLGRVGEPQEVASAVGWLLSDEASYVTGAVVRVSGGL